MKDKRILKDFETSKMSLNIYTSPLLALFFVYVSEFIASLFFGLSFLALIGLFSSLGVGGQRIADFLQALFHNISDRVSDVHLIFELLSFGFIILTVFILQGTAEELVTRAWLIPQLAKRTNLKVAIVISSSLFTLLHLGNSGITPLSAMNLFLFGIAMALYLLKTDTIWGIGGIHGAWNFAQGNLFGILVSGQQSGTSIMEFTPQGNQDWLSGGSFGIEGSIMTSLVLLLLIAYLAYQLKKENERM